MPYPLSFAFSPSAAERIRITHKSAKMQKDRPVDWQDTNMSLFGSDIEKKCKAAAADSEPQWDDAGVKPGLQVS